MEWASRLLKGRSSGASKHFTATRSRPKYGVTPCMIPSTRFEIFRPHFQRHHPRSEIRRHFHVVPPQRLPPAAPKSKDRGPKSDEETQTDFGVMNVLGNTPIPTTAVDTCMDQGFALDSGLKVTGSGVFLLGGEAFKWRPWIQEGRKEGTIGAGGLGDDEKGVQSTGGKLLNHKGQLEMNKDSWGILDLVWPKPDLLVLGTGPRTLPVSPQTRRHLTELGIRIEVLDTRNAAAQFNLLATERGVQQVAAALIPIGWKEGS